VVGTRSSSPDHARVLGRRPDEPVRCGRSVERPRPPARALIQMPSVSLWRPCWPSPARFSRTAIVRLSSASIHHLDNAVCNPGVISFSCSAANNVHFPFCIHTIIPIVYRGAFFLPICFCRCSNIPKCVSLYSKLYCTFIHFMSSLRD